MDHICWKLWNTKDTFLIHRIRSFSAPSSFSTMLYWKLSASLIGFSLMPTAPFSGLHTSSVFLMLILSLTFSPPLANCLSCAAFFWFHGLAVWCHLQAQISMTLIFPLYSEICQIHSLSHHVFNDHNEQKRWQNAALSHSRDDAKGRSSASGCLYTAAWIVIHHFEDGDIS